MGGLYDAATLHARYNSEFWALILWKARWSAYPPVKFASALSELCPIDNIVDVKTLRRGRDNPGFT